MLRSGSASASYEAKPSERGNHELRVILQHTARERERERE